MAPSDLTTTSFGRLSRRPWKLAACHPSRVMLTGKEAPLQVAREPVGAIGRLQEHADALARHVLHAAVVMNVAEQQVAAFLDPHRAFSRTKIAAEAAGQFLDGFRCRDDLVECGVILFDALGRLRRCAVKAS